MVLSAYGDRGFLGFSAFSVTDGNKATQPCPCGYYGDLEGRCRCTSEQVQRYRAKISGPLLDRIDMHIEVARPPNDALFNPRRDGETSTTVRERVERARQRQMQRSGVANSQLAGEQLEQAAPIDPAGRQLLERAVAKLGLSPRTLHRILRVARTIADLAGADDIGTAHISEAIGYRKLDRR